MILVIIIAIILLSSMSYRRPYRGGLFSSLFMPRYHREPMHHEPMHHRPYNHGASPMGHGGHMGGHMGGHGGHMGGPGGHRH